MPKMMSNLTHSLHLALADFWVFLTIKAILGDTHSNEESIITVWERVGYTINTGDFLVAFNNWLELKE